MKKYKHNIKNNTLEITHNFITDTNLKITFNETIPYSKEKEIALLKEIREEVIQKLNHQNILLDQNMNLKRQLYQEITTTGLGFLTNTPLGLIVCGVTGCLAFKDSAEFIKNILELNNSKKQLFYIENESRFNELNLKQLTSELKKMKLKRKLKKLISVNSQININNVNNFSQKELKKLI